MLRPTLDFERQFKMAPQQTLNASKGEMSCMEVWGGSCASRTRLRRPGLDLWVQSQAVAEPEAGGGDMHLLSSCASGRITRMLLADICGFGPMHADLGAELRDLMKQNVNSIQQARFVTDVTRRLNAASQQGGFASLLIGTYFAPTRSFRLCNVGHPPPFVYRRQDASWTVMLEASTKQSAADTDGAVSVSEYQRIKTKLDRGDLVVCYSNVLTECHDKYGNTLGCHGLLDRVRRLDPSRAADFGSELIDGLLQENRNNAMAEEATVVVCQATNTKVGWRDNLLAPFRLLRPVADRTNLS